MNDEKIQQPSAVQDTPPRKGEASEILFGGKTYQLRKQPDKGWRLTIAGLFFVLASVFFICALLAVLLLPYAGIFPETLAELGLAFGIFLPSIVCHIIAKRLLKRPEDGAAQSEDEDR